MNSFVFLFFMGLLAYVVIRPFVYKWADNSGEIDLEEEKKLTERY